MLAPEVESTVPEASHNWHPQRAPFQSDLEHRMPSLLLEQRAGIELAQLFASPVYYGVGVPRGTGGPVLLLPGFMGADAYLAPMSGWLRRIGYRPHYSRLAIAAGPPMGMVAHVLKRVDDITATTGQRVDIIGHSLGGALGNVVGRLRPTAVRHVVTLGSPQRIERRSTNPFVAHLADTMLSNGSWPEAKQRDEEEEAYLTQVMTTPLTDTQRAMSVYTREDAVVHWRTCTSGDPRTENVEVRGTHTGLAWNPDAYRHIGRALAQAA